MLPLIIGALGIIAYGMSEENKKPKAVKKMAKGGRIGQNGYAIMVDGKLRTDAWKRVEFFATIEKALFTLSHIPFYKPLSKEEKLKLIVPYTIPKMAKGGNTDENIIKNKYNSFVEKFENNETFIDKLKFNYKNNTHYFYVDIDVKSFYNEAKRYLRKNGWQITDEDVNKKNFIAIIPNKMAQGGGLPMSNEMYNKLDKIKNWEIVRKEKHPSKRENVFYTMSKSGDNYKIAIEYDGKIKYPTYFTNKKTAESEFNKMLSKYFAKGGDIKNKSVWENNGFIDTKRTMPPEWKFVEWSLNGHSPYFKGQMYFQKGTGFVFIEKENGELYEPKPSNKLFWREIKENKMAQGGNIETKIDALYKKSGFINDDYNWKSKMLEMLQDSSVEAYQIYQKLTAKQKKDVLEELFEMENDMGADGDEDIETSKENLSMFLSDSKNGKKY